MSGGAAVNDEIIFDIDNINLGEAVPLELLIKDNAKEKESSDYIKSWVSVSQGGVDCYSNQIDDMTSLKVLKFEIVSARTIESKKQKKYVAYTLTVRVLSDTDDSHPAVLERRYNDFLNLYNELKKKFANQLASIQFPKKTLMGNFSPEVIVGRRLGFEAFLDIIANTTEMRCCQAVATFFQEPELLDALKLINDKQYYQALPLIENSFWVMNKLQTDRSPAVLRNLCLWICVSGESGDPHAVGLAGLAVRRFQGVSDSDLLRYYVPLLSTTIELCRRHGKDGTPIVDHLDSLIKRGLARPSTQPLLQILLEDLTSNNTE